MKPRNAMNDRIQQQKLRDRRKELGWKRITIWLDPEELEALNQHDKDWLGTTVKALLKSSLSDKYQVNSGKGQDLSDKYDDDDRAGAVSNESDQSPIGDNDDATVDSDDAGAGFALNTTVPVPTVLEARIITAVNAVNAAGGKINRAQIGRELHCTEGNVRRVIKKYHLGAQ